MSSGASPTGTVVVGRDANSNVIVQTFALSANVAPENIDSARREVSGVVASIAQQPGGSVESALVDARLGNVPAFSVRVRFTTPDGVPVLATLHFGFHGSTEYFVNCESATSEQAEIKAGCDRVVRTFHVT
jgi:hypothetical protein